MVVPDQMELMAVTGWKCSMLYLRDTCVCSQSSATLFCETLDLVSQAASGRSMLVGTLQCTLQDSVTVISMWTFLLSVYISLAPRLGSLVLDASGTWRLALQRTR